MIIGFDLILDIALGLILIPVLEVIKGDCLPLSTGKGTQMYIKYQQ